MSIFKKNAFLHFLCKECGTYGIENYSLTNFKVKIRTVHGDWRSSTSGSGQKDFEVAELEVWLHFCNIDKSAPKVRIVLAAIIFIKSTGPHFFDFRDVFCIPSHNIHKIQKILYLLILYLLFLYTFLFS